MAVPPQSNEAFLREVDEELRRDELKNFWRRWGLWLAIAAVALLIALGGWFWWQNHQQSQASEMGTRVGDALTAVEAGNETAAAPVLAEAAESDVAGYRAAARFAQADLLAAKGDMKGAAAEFAAVAADEDQTETMRALARIRQTSAEFDTLQPQAVIDRMRAMAVPESPWFGSAGEMVAISYLRMNRADLAGKLFGDIAKGENVPGSIRARAVQMAGALGVDALDPEPAAEPDTPGNATAPIEEKNAK